jgi:hypothetical protein
VIRCNIAAGDVTITIDDSVSTLAGRVLTTSFITQGATGAYKLLFRQTGSPTMPGILASTHGQRTSGIPTTSMTNSTSDNRAHSCPLGDDRVAVFILMALRANDLNSNTMHLQLTVDGGTMFEVGDATHPWTYSSGAVSADADIFIYIHPMGSDSDITPMTSKVMIHDLNCCGYVLFAIHAEHVDQTTPSESFTPGHDDGPSSLSMSILCNALGPNRRIIYAAVATSNITGYPVPTLANATQLNSGTIGLSANLNASGGPYIDGHEEAVSSGTYDCTVTFPALNDRSRVALALRPAALPTMDIRTPANVAAETAVTNKQIGLIYDGNAKIANLIF